MDDVCKEMVREVQVIKEGMDYKEGQRKKNFPTILTFCPAIVHAIRCLDGSNISCHAWNQCAGKSHHQGLCLLAGLDVLASF